MLQFSEEETNAGIKQFLADLNAEGITSVCDVSLLAVPGGDFVRDDVYRALYERGDLTVRINMFPTALEDLARARALHDEFAGNDLLRSPGLKQFFDGVSSTHTAWLTEPYANAAYEGECGAPVTDPERMRRIVLGAAEEGFAVRIHTIGDRAIHVALDIFEEAREKFGPVAGQNGLEHLENFLPEDIARLAELDVSANCQPPHTVLDPNGIERDLGPERARWMWPYRSYLDAGVKFSFGTDSPVVDINSREVIYDAVTRQSPATGEPTGGWQPQEKIDAADAVRAYTLGSAVAAGRGDEVGSLEVGKLADLAVLDTDLVTCAPEKILGAKVLATYLGGRRCLGLNIPIPFFFGALTRNQGTARVGIARRTRIGRLNSDANRGYTEGSGSLCTKTRDVRVRRASENAFESPIRAPSRAFRYNHVPDLAFPKPSKNRATRWQKRHPARRGFLFKHDRFRCKIDVGPQENAAG